MTDLLDFGEQIDKLKFYDQQGGGSVASESGNHRRFYRGQRGRGVITSFIKRYAYPALKSVYNYAKPFVTELFTGAKSAAAETIKEVATQNLNKLTEKIKNIQTKPPATENKETPDSGGDMSPAKKQCQPTRKRRRKRTNRKRAPKRRKTTRKSNVKTVARRKRRVKVNSKSFDIFK